MVRLFGVAMKSKRSKACESFHANIRVDSDSCYLCNAPFTPTGYYNMTWSEWHHVWGGTNRKLSEQDGAKVRLCHDCHNEPPIGVHHNSATDLQLKRECQQWLMKNNNWSISDFAARYGKSWLDEEW